MNVQDFYQKMQRIQNISRLIQNSARIIKYLQEFAAFARISGTMQTSAEIKRNQQKYKKCAKICKN